MAAPPLFAGQIDLLDITKPETLQALAGAAGVFIGVISGLQAFRSKPPLDAPQTGTAVRRELDKKNVATGADIDDLKRLLTAKAGLSDEQARRVLEAFGENLSDRPIDPAEYEMRLLALAGQFVEQLAKAEAATNDRPEIANLRAQAAEALRNAHFIEAEQLFARISEEHLETGVPDVLAAASATAEQGGAARLRGDLLDAASRYGRAADLSGPFDAESAWMWRFTQADILDDHGHLFPGPSKAEAARIWRDECLPHTPKDTQPAKWAMTQNNLGTALKTVGERASGEAGLLALSDAIAAFDAALEVRTEQDFPVEWAGTQNNLGNALKTLGERAGGEAGLSALNKAAAAYQSALRVYTENDTPAQWAMTQNNLGVVLTALGRLTGGEARLKMFNEAVVAYEAALRVYSERDSPANWASTLNNLGNALGFLGGHAGGESQLAALRKAIEAYEDALRVRTEGAMPAQWAMTKNNLGNALSTMGQRIGGEQGVQTLNSAIAAFEAALRVRTKDAMPAQWAFTTENLYLAREGLSKVTRDSEHVCAAADGMVAVIAVFEAMQAPYFVEKAQRNHTRMITVCRELGGTCTD